MMSSPPRWTWPAGLLLALPLATSLVVRLDATTHATFARRSSCSRDSQPLMAQPHDPIGNAPVQGGRPQGGRSRFTGMAPSTSTASPGFTSASAAEQTRDSSPYAAVASPYAAVDYAAVRRELKLLMDNPSWDDGSLAPIFIRLAWHSSGTYDEASGTGGSNGAGMRFSTEAADPENAGLATARAFLEPVKRRFPAISYSDLWVLAAYVGIEHTGGPTIPFSPGRSDHQDEAYWKGMSYGRLPAAEKYLCPALDPGQVAGSSCPARREDVVRRRLSLSLSLPLSLARSLWRSIPLRIAEKATAPPPLILARSSTRLTHAPRTLRTRGATGRGGARRRLGGPRQPRASRGLRPDGLRRPRDGRAALRRPRLRPLPPQGLRMCAPRLRPRHRLLDQPYHTRPAPILPPRPRARRPHPPRLPRSFSSSLLTRPPRRAHTIPSPPSLEQTRARGWSTRRSSPTSTPPT